MIQKTVSFLRHDIWRFDLQSLSRFKRWGLGTLRILTLSLRDFVSDACTLRASALTFFSLLAIVPTVAVAFGLAQGFGLDRRLEALLFEQLSGQEAVAERIVEFSRALLANTQGGLIAGVGVLLLLWTVIKLISHIEQAFNEIWQVAQGRTWVRKFADYTALIFVCPVLLLLASSSTVIITARLERLKEDVTLLTQVEPLVTLPLRLLPFFTVWILFTFVYLIIPNAKVRFSAALAGGIVAGSAYQLLQLLLVNTQIGVVQYNTIYGSFAALPLFLLWLQLSWMIVLYGAEFAYACQHASNFEFEPDCRSASLHLRCLAALRIVQYCIECFRQGGGPAPHQRQIAVAIGAPPYLTRDLLARLVAAGVLVKVEQPLRGGYQPACDPAALTIHFVVERLLRQGTEWLPNLPAADFQQLRDGLEGLSRDLQKSQHNLKLN